MPRALTYVLILLAVIAVLALVFYVSHALVSEAGVDLKYWAGGLLLWFILFSVFLVAEITLRAKWAAKDLANLSC